MAAPTAIRLSQTAINEGELPGGFVAVLATVDADPADTFSYELVDGEGDEHNAWFQIQRGNLLVNTKVVDREQLASLSLRLRSTDSSGQSLEQALSLAVNNLQDPLLLAGPEAISFSRAGGSFHVALSELFADPFSSGRIARFHLDPDLAATIQAALAEPYPELAGRSWLDVVLFDQPEQGAPQTVANLERYVVAGLYADTFLHRLVPNFVIQGGGFVWPGGEEDATTNPPSVPTFAAVPNEFSSQRSNIRGTVAMAKLPEDPDSATSQWFFSLADNSADLDAQNGGFSVFGRLRDGTDLLLMDVLGSRSTVAAGGAFNNLPLYKLGDQLDPTDVLRFRDVELLEEPSLRFELTAPDTAPLQATLDSDAVLHVDAPATAGSATQTTSLSLTATNLLGERVERRLDVITGWTADLDGNGRVDPLSDGLAVAAAAAGSPLPELDTDVLFNLQRGIQDGHLDLDGNGRVDPVDAQLLLRFSFGTFPGASLTQGLFLPDQASSTISTDQLISERLQMVHPPL